jgi:hypothetical protein
MKKAAVISWIMIGLGIDAVFGVLAYRNLTQNFRETVAARFDKGGKGWLRRVFSSGPAATQPARTAFARQRVASSWQ